MFFYRLFIFLILTIIFIIPFLVIFVLVFLFIDKKVFFIQKRFGQNRKIFKLIKFSTMTNNNNQDNLLINENHRINKIGKFIRKSHLDEIPQIFNILLNNMNFIGPRPWSIGHDEIYRKLLADRTFFLQKYFERACVKPGIIGLAQLKNLDDETIKSISKRLRYDFFYIKYKSFSLNLYIVFSTIKKIFKTLINL